MVTNILSIQSSVAFGHVGNSAAVFPLQRLGFEIWPVNTVAFSNHPGYGAWRGRIAPSDAVAEIIDGIAERGVLPSCGAVLSGYLGEATTGVVVRDAVQRVKAANPAAIYCCDPVIGDRGSGVFVRPGIAEFFRQELLALADIATPNQFELEHLTGHHIETLDEALAAAVLAGPRIIVVTSLERRDAPPRVSEMLAVEHGKAWLVTTPLLPLSVNGAGDAVAALFLGHYLTTGSTDAALGATASSIFAILEATLAAGSRELSLVAAQDEFVTPRRLFTAQRVR